jgi:hypothetical protein
VTRAPPSQEQRLAERSRSSRRMDETTVFLSGSYAVFGSTGIDDLLPTVKANLRFG